MVTILITPMCCLSWWQQSFPGETHCVSPLIVCVRACVRVCVCICWRVFALYVCPLSSCHWGEGLLLCGWRRERARERESLSHTPLHTQTQQEATEAHFEATEAHLETTIQNLRSRYATRVAISPRDVQLARRLRGEREYGW